jgi:hypothetical protein
MSGGDNASRDYELSAPMVPEHGGYYGTVTTELYLLSIHENKATM